MRSMITMLMGFFAALIFVVCADIDTKAIASAIAEAIDISYDNSNSSLRATTVQEALDELSTPVVELTGKYCASGAHGGFDAETIEVVFSNTTATVTDAGGVYCSFDRVEPAVYFSTGPGSNGVDCTSLMEVGLIATFIKITVYSKVFIVRPCE